jgi:hypothetical protein
MDPKKCGQSKNKEQEREKKTSMMEVKIEAALLRGRRFYSKEIRQDWFEKSYRHGFCK